MSLNSSRSTCTYTCPMPLEQINMHALYIAFHYIIAIKTKNFMIFWKSCDKVRKYQSFKSHDEYTYITERNFKYSGVDQELSQYSRPWQPESSVLHLVQSNKRINDHDSDCIPLSIPRVGRPSQVASLHPKSLHQIT